MARRQFSLLSLDPPRPDPIEFALGDEWFRCEDEIPAAASHALVSLSPIESTMAFIRGVLIESHVERFDKTVARKGRNSVVTDAILSDVLTYLIEQYTDRPTSPPEPSPGGRQATQDASTANASSEAVPVP